MFDYMFVDFSYAIIYLILVNLELVHSDNHSSCDYLKIYFFRICFDGLIDLLCYSFSCICVTFGRTIYEKRK